LIPILTTPSAKAAIMDVGAILDKIPTPVVLLFTILGVIFAARKVISYIQLLLSLFVLPGTNVRQPTLIFLRFNNANWR
jgi:hypothetical protein